MVVIVVVVVAVFASSLVVVADLWSRLPRRVPVRGSRGDGAAALPAGFVWGTATADHQIERAQADNWTAFVAAARSAGRDQQTGPGAVPPGHVAGITRVPSSWIERTSDFDTHFADDLRRARALGHGAHRFSISWARLFPRAGMEAPDADGLAFYDAVFDALAREGLRPFVTLFHFASPQWLWETDARGRRGFERDEFVPAFAAFVDVVVARWGARIASVCTLNEPMVVAYSGYVDGTFPPGERRTPDGVVDVVAALLRMHVAAWRSVKARHPNLEVGIAHHVRRFLPLRNGRLLDRVTAWMVDRAFVLDFLDAIATGVLSPSLSGQRREIEGLRGTMDYVGVNYYGRFYLRSNAPGRFDVLLRDDDAPDEEVTAVGWAIDEDGFTETLQRFARRYRKPLHVLENGIADDGGPSGVDDVARQQFLVRHVRALAEAVNAGVDVRSYFVWSLIDNFEWALGFGPRFGLYAVDYDTGARTPRDSVEVMRELARARGVSAALWERFRRR